MEDVLTWYSKDDKGTMACKACGYDENVTLSGACGGCHKDEWLPSKETECNVPDEDKKLFAHRKGDAAAAKGVKAELEALSAALDKADTKTKVMPGYNLFDEIVAPGDMQCTDCGFPNNTTLAFPCGGEGTLKYACPTGSGWQPTQATMQYVPSHEKGYLKVKGKVVAVPSQAKPGDWWLDPHKKQWYYNDPSDKAKQFNWKMKPSGPEGIKLEQEEGSFKIQMHAKGPEGEEEQFEEHEGFALVPVEKLVSWDTDMKRLREMRNDARDSMRQAQTEIASLHSMSKPRRRTHAVHSSAKAYEEWLARKRRMMDGGQSNSKRAIAARKRKANEEAAAILANLMVAVGFEGADEVLGRLDAE